MTFVLDNIIVDKDYYDALIAANIEFLGGKPGYFLGAIPSKMLLMSPCVLLLIILQLLVQKRIF